MAAPATKKRITEITKDMKFTSISIVLISILLSACSNQNKSTTKIEGSYFDENIRIDITEVVTKKKVNSSRTSVTAPLINVKAENAKLETILKLVLASENIEIKNKTLADKRFNFEINCSKDLPNQDSVIASHLLPMICEKYSIVHTPMDDLNISIFDQDKFNAYASKTEKINGKTRSSSKKVNNYLTVENHSLDALMKIINKEHEFTYTICDDKEQRIDYQLDLSNWEEIKLTLSQDLGLELNVYQTQNYKITIE